MSSLRNQSENQNNFPSEGFNAQIIDSIEENYENNKDLHLTSIENFEQKQGKNKKKHQQNTPPFDSLSSLSIKEEKKSEEIVVKLKSKESQSEQYDKFFMSEEKNKYSSFYPNNKVYPSSFKKSKFLCQKTRKSIGKARISAEITVFGMFFSLNSSFLNHKSKAIHCFYSAQSTN